MKRASLLSRIVAAFIDMYLVVMLILIFTFTLLNIFEDQVVLMMGLSFLCILLGITAFVFKDMWDGRSVGKRIFNLGIREQDGSVPSRQMLIKRNLSSMFWPRDVYNLLFGTDKRKQGDIKYGTDVFQLEKTKSVTTKALRIVIPIALILVLFVGIIFNIIKQNASYKTAITFIENDKQIQALVGEQMKFGYFPSGSITTTNGSGVAAFTIKVTGDRSSLSVFIVLRKEPNEPWRVQDVSHEGRQAEAPKIEYDEPQRIMMEATVTSIPYESDEDLEISVLNEEVPEIEEYQESKKKADPDFQFYLHKNEEPVTIEINDSESSEYYKVEVGEIVKGKKKVWNEFAVEYELEDILVKDRKSNKFIELDEWRSRK